MKSYFKNRDSNFLGAWIRSDKVKTKLFPKITGKVNIDKTLTSNDFANLFAPVEVNSIGVKGVPVAVQTFDFEKKHYFPENDVTRFISLTKTLELSGQQTANILFWEESLKLVIMIKIT